MPNINAQVDFVIGVDTHKHSHTGSVIDRNGAALATISLATDAFGHRRLLRFAHKHAPGPRLWAIEGSGSYGQGLTTYLLENAEAVAEIDRPALRNGTKSDELDATRAAREALARAYLAQPRRRGKREAIRVLLRTRQGAVLAKSRALCHLKALVVTAAEPLRHQLHKLDTDALVIRCGILPSRLMQRRAHSRNDWSSMFGSTTI